MKARVLRSNGAEQGHTVQARMGKADGDGSASRLETFLRAALTRGVRQNAMAEVAMQISRVGGLIILAHTLLPSDFGLFRVVMTVGSIVLLTTQVGLPD